jgi:hypothetical protein
VLHLPDSLKEQQWKLVVQATFWQWSAIWHWGLITYAFREYLLGNSPVFLLIFVFTSFIVVFFLLKPSEHERKGWGKWILHPRAGYFLLLLSMLRYVIYASILYLGLTLSPSLFLPSYQVFIPLILLSFSLQFAVPVLPILDFGLRTSVLFWIFDPFGVDVASVASWAFLLWFFNLIVPSTVGLVVGWLWSWE